MRQFRPRILLAGAVFCFAVVGLGGAGAQDRYDPDIYLMNPDGSGRVNLTNDPAFEFSASWVTGRNEDRLCPVASRSSPISAEVRCS